MKDKKEKSKVKASKTTTKPSGKSIGGGGIKDPKK
jgi:hypothetical protein